MNNTQWARDSPDKYDSSDSGHSEFKSTHRKVLRGNENSIGTACKNFAGLNNFVQSLIEQESSSISNLLMQSMLTNLRQFRGNASEKRVFMPIPLRTSDPFFSSLLQHRRSSWDDRGEVHSSRQIINADEIDACKESKYSSEFLKDDHHEHCVQTESFDKLGLDVAILQSNETELQVSRSPFWAVNCQQWN